MRDDAVREFLKKARVDWNTIKRLIEENKLIEVTYKDRLFWIRRLRNN